MPPRNKLSQESLATIIIISLFLPQMTHRTHPPSLSPDSTLLFSPSLLITSLDLTFSISPFRQTYLSNYYLHPLPTSHSNSLPRPTNSLNFNCHSAYQSTLTSSSIQFGMINCLNTLIPLLFLFFFSYHLRPFCFSGPIYSLYFLSDAFLKGNTGSYHSVTYDFYLAIFLIHTIFLLFCLGL